MTNQQTHAHRQVFSYEASCLIVAASEDEASRKLNDMLIEADRYWIDEGSPATDEEQAELLAKSARQA